MGDGERKSKNQKSKIKNGWSYKLWKFIEFKLIHTSSSIITTSTPFKEYVIEKLKVKGEKLNVIPNCANTSRFKPDEAKRKKLRTRYGLTNNFVLIHSGAFGTPQDIPIIGEYFLKWKKIINDESQEAHLVILCGTKKYLPHIREVLERVGVLKEDYTLINPNFEDVPNLLLLGDVGLHLETMAIATPYCIAIKDGEYLASGLPVIVTPWLKGIGALIEKYGAGIIVNPHNEEFANEKKLIEKHNEMRENGFKLVREHLSLENCVKKLLELYQ